MSDQNLLVKLVKKSVGLPTSESDCCGVVVPQTSQEIANQRDREQPVDSSSCCDSQESEETVACGCGGGVAPQASQETANQCDEK